MSIADRAVDIALGEVGKSYESHRDCSGFVAWVARQVGVTIPEGSVAQWSVGHPVPSKAQVQAGDLLFWDTFGAAPGHVALAINPSQVVHAINEQQGIVIDAINADMGGPYMGARRIFTGDSSSPSPETPPKVQKPRDRQRTREQDRTRRRRRKA